MSHATLVIRQAATLATSRPVRPRPPPAKPATGLLGDITLVLVVIAAAGLLQTHRLPVLAFVFLCLASIGLIESLRSPLRAR